MGEILIYCAAWLIFGVAHSLLAREGAKSALKPLLGPWYRLAYNLFAVIQLGAVYAFGFWVFEGGQSLDRPLAVVYAQYGLMFAGWGLLVLALREYDLGRLGGLSQIREHRTGVLVDDDEPLHFKGLHCWVRHPLYSAGLLILWGGVGSDFQVWTALFASLYFWIGSVYEERHLIRTYGTVYETYKTRVPAFIPFKGPQNVEDLNP